MRYSDIPETAGFRLNRFLARAGVASRRICDTLIQEGKVAVNKQIILIPGFRVNDSDIVTCNGKQVNLPPLVTAILNKPPGFETTLARTVEKNITSFMHELPQGTVPAGRLDIDTAGLLILSNDGELIHRLSHPSWKIEREYLANLELPIPGNVLKNLRNGADIGNGEYSKPDAVFREGKGVFRIILHTGRNREVRRLLKAYALKLKQLTRIRYSTINLDNLPEGTIRILKDIELTELYDSVKLTLNTNT